MEHYTAMFSASERGMSEVVAYYISGVVDLFVLVSCPSPRIPHVGVRLLVLTVEMNNFTPSSSSLNLSGGGPLPSL
jgi:hypothetical protein